MDDHEDHAARLSRTRAWDLSFCRSLCKTLQSTWPRSDKSGPISCKLALILLEDPNFRLKLTHAEAILRQRHPGIFESYGRPDAQPDQGQLMRELLSDPAACELFTLVSPSSFRQYTFCHSDIREVSSSEKYVLYLNVQQLMQHGTMSGHLSVASASAALPELLQVQAGKPPGGNASLKFPNQKDSCHPIGEVFACIEVTWPDWLWCPDEHLAAVCSLALFFQSHAITESTAKGTSRPSAVLSSRDLLYWLGLLRFVDKLIAQHPVISGGGETAGVGGDIPAVKNCFSGRVQPSSAAEKALSSFLVMHPACKACFRLGRRSMDQGSAMKDHVLASATDDVQQLCLASENLSAPSGQPQVREESMGLFRKMWEIFQCECRQLWQPFTKGSNSCPLLQEGDLDDASTADLPQFLFDFEKSGSFQPSSPSQRPPIVLSQTHPWQGSEAQHQGQHPRLSISLPPRDPSAFSTDSLASSPAEAACASALTQQHSRAGSSLTSGIPCPRSGAVRSSGPASVGRASGDLPPSSPLFSSQGLQGPRPPVPQEVASCWGDSQVGAEDAAAGEASLSPTISGLPVDNGTDFLSLSRSVPTLPEHLGVDGFGADGRLDGHGPFTRYSLGMSGSPHGLAHMGPLVSSALASEHSNLFCLHSSDTALGMAGHAASGNLAGGTLEGMGLLVRNNSSSSRLPSGALPHTSLSASQVLGNHRYWMDQAGQNGLSRSVGSGARAGGAAHRDDCGAVQNCGTPRTGGGGVEGGNGGEGSIHPDFPEDERYKELLAALGGRVDLEAALAIMNCQDGGVADAVRLMGLQQALQQEQGGARGLGLMHAASPYFGHGEGHDFPISRRASAASCSPGAPSSFGSATRRSNPGHLAAANGRVAGGWANLTTAGAGPIDVQNSSLMGIPRRSSQNSTALPHLDGFGASSNPLSFPTAGAMSTPEKQLQNSISSFAAMSPNGVFSGQAAAGNALEACSLSSPANTGAMFAGKPEMRMFYRLSPKLRLEIVNLLRIVPGLKLEDFDEGVIYQLAAKKNEEEALGALRMLACNDVSGIQHLAAYINHVVKNYHVTPGAEGGTLTPSAVVRASSVPVSSKAILQKLPFQVYKRLEDIVSTCSYMEWKHFDAGVIKVMGQLSEICPEDVLEELDQLEHTDLSNVEYMPAYLNKRLNNRLWSRRKSQRQQPAPLSPQHL